MEFSILVARILAVTYLCAAIGIFSGRVSIEDIMKDYERSPGLMYLSGFITLVIGMILVTYHNRWDGGWPVVVTVVGWLTLLKGVMLMAFPKAWLLFKKSYTNTKLWSIPLLCLGLLFAYFGFVL